MKRLDQLIVDLGLSESRNRAQRVIKEGLVTVTTTQGVVAVVTKPSAKFDDSVSISLESSIQDRYVSRAGLKLEGALSVLSYDLSQHRVLDIGCSTGGFTDCALKHGASLVVGIDVGHDQLHPSLIADPRVTLYEGINARSMPTEQLKQHAPEGFDTLVMDVSFISQTLILPGVSKVMSPTGRLISLVKPQFELQPGDIGRGGIVRDASLYKRVHQKIKDCCHQHGLAIEAYLESPITGSDGNREFLALIQRQPSS